MFGCLSDFAMRAVISAREESTATAVGLAVTGTANGSLIATVGVKDARLSAADPTPSDVWMAPQAVGKRRSVKPGADAGLRTASAQRPC